MSGFIPSHNDHQVDRIINRYYVPDQILIDFHDSEKTFTHSSDSPYTISVLSIHIFFKMKIISPVVPFILSTHPGIGSFRAPTTIDGRTIASGMFPHLSLSICSAKALVKV